jgi:hypothetical protein
MRNAWAVISMALCPGIFFISGSHGHAWIMIHWVHKYYSVHPMKKILMCHNFLGIYPGFKNHKTFSIFHIYPTHSDETEDKIYTSFPSGFSVVFEDLHLALCLERLKHKL